MMCLISGEGSYNSTLKVSYKTLQGIMATFERLLDDINCLLPKGFSKASSGIVLSWTALVVNMQLAVMAYLR